MYEGFFFTPGDFASTSSEENLEIYRGSVSRYPNVSRWQTLRFILHKFDISCKEVEKGYDIFPVDQRIDSTNWLEIASNYLKLAGSPENILLSFVENGHLARDEGDDVVLVGEGNNRWIVLHWYTTA